MADKVSNSELENEMLPNEFEISSKALGEDDAGISRDLGETRN